MYLVLTKIMKKEKKAKFCAFEYNCYHDTFHVLRDHLNSVFIYLHLVKEQVLHWDEAEPWPAGRSHEALLRSRSRETRQHAPAWVHSKSLHCAMHCVNMHLFKCYFPSALLKKAHSMPFQVKPSTMASVVKGLYALRPGERICLLF